MEGIGTRKKPALVRVQTEERSAQVLAFCQENDIAVLVSVDPDKAEDIADVERAVAARNAARAAAKVGRNNPCPCGSGKKFKKCCIDKPPTRPA